ncbi:MAG TPA: glucose 1-dehydrogenase [Chloroflexota bacterium]|jgi:meso-butanediol dehydrogenase/(S,S)-butanediol dehydrogenase/diacetyl reductase|nr:glucose 1-dehydrogenase [Chloroflexota bacterium]
MASYDLDGQVAVVTGGARGIGRAISLRLAREGAALVVGDLDPAGAEAVAAEIGAAGGRALGLRADVTVRADAGRLVDAAVSGFGGLDLLVNNAGILRVAPLLETDEELWDRTFDVNVKGMLFCSQAAARRMIAQGRGGRIINAASGAAKFGPALPIGAYAASKHAVLGLTRCLAVELAPHGILVNCYCPGIVDTPMWDVIDREVATLRGVPPGSVKAEAVASIPLGRMQTPEDVANVVAFFASADASYVTADAFNNSGGLQTW